MKLFLALLLLTLAGLGISYLISPLRTFNTLVPKDPGGQKIASDIAYGAHARQKLDIYAPLESNDDLRPVILWFYGGSWKDGTRHGYDFVGRAFAAQGFVTIIPDYRLVPEVRFPGFVEDGAAALRWVRRQVADYGGDPDRVVLAGHSAGAHIAAMLASDPQWLGDDRARLRGFVGIAGPYDFAPFTSQAAKDAFDAWPQVAETQPVTFADAGNPPSLLLTGDSDDTVEPRNSRSLAARLEAAGVAVELVEYAGIGHVDILTALARPLRGKAPVLENAAQFAHRVTAGSNAAE